MSRAIFSSKTLTSVATVHDGHGHGHGRTYGSNQNKKKVSTAPTPYCGTCHKAGLTLAEYTSHWTKSSPDASGVVVCPLILNSECGYCHERGHFIKYCPILSARKKNDARRNTGANTTVVTKSLSTFVANRFASLDDDGDIHSDVDVDVDVETVEMDSSRVLANEPIRPPSYASVLRQPASSVTKRDAASIGASTENPSAKMRRLNVTEILALASAQVVEQTKPPSTPFIKSSRSTKRFWADYDDDDEDFDNSPASDYTGNDAW